MNPDDQDMTDDQERAEIERILRETQELEAKRRAENAEFQEFLRNRKRKDDE